MSEYNTVIGQNTKFEGSVTLDTDFLICGSFKGDITSTANIEVAEGGILDAKFECSCLIVKGKAKGEVKCSDCLTVADSGEYVGNITTRNISAGPGALIDGSITMIRE